MILRCRPPGRCARMRGTQSYRAMRFHHCWSSTMKWETPQATDFRFGMEITMYIANR